MIFLKHSSRLFFGWLLHQFAEGKTNELPQLLSSSTAKLIIFVLPTCIVLACIKIGLYVQSKQCSNIFQHKFLCALFILCLEWFLQALLFFKPSCCISLFLHDTTFDFVFAIRLTLFSKMWRWVNFIQNNYGLSAK